MGLYVYVHDDQFYARMFLNVPVKIGFVCVQHVFFRILKRCFEYTFEKICSFVLKVYMCDVLYLYTFCVSMLN